MNDEKQLSSLTIDDTVYESHVTRKYLARKKYSPAEPNKICAFIPGIIRKVYVHNGQSVSKGDALLILEAMKMMNNLTSPLEGRVKKVYIQEGQMVTKGQLLIELE